MITINKSLLYLLIATLYLLTVIGVAIYLNNIKYVPKSYYVTCTYSKFIETKIPMRDAEYVFHNYYFDISEQGLLEREIICLNYLVDTELLK